jgi:hypothetical protein
VEAHELDPVLARLEAEAGALMAFWNASSDH